MVFVDEDEDPPEYRRIVDLEWSIDDIIIRDDQCSAYWAASAQDRGLSSAETSRVLYINYVGISC